MKKLILFFFIIIIFTSFHTDCSGWWTSKSDNELLAEALKSTDPDTVEQCLHQQIQKKNYAGILRLRLRAREMVRKEKNKLNTSGGITPQELQKNIDPWLRIEQTATQFYKESIK